MISDIEWVPAGVADPNPKRYEMSTAEHEFIKMMQEQGTIETLEEEVSKEQEAKTILQRVNGSELPADLRMDEYSSDEEENDMAIGEMLVGKGTSLSEDMIPTEEIQDEAESDNDNDQEDNGDEGATNRARTEGSSDDDEYDSDDDLNDVPDTREFMPVDVQGLEAMGLSQVGGTAYMNDEEEDDESEAEDVRLTEDDAILVVAKTEDVSFFIPFVDQSF